MNGKKVHLIGNKVFLLKAQFHCQSIPIVYRHYEISQRMNCIDKVDTKVKMNLNKKTQIMSSIDER